MTVSINGPEGYEYQYLSSVYIILLYIRNHQLEEGFIEKLNSEDLSLRLANNNHTDFQFKKKQDELNIDFLASCLVKFDPRSSTVNVLSKLESGDLNDFVIVTNTRVGNYARDIGILLKDSSVTDHISPKSKANQKSYSDLLKALERVYNGSTPLEKKRKVFVQNQVKDIRTNKTIARLLERTHVLENAQRDLIQEKIKTFLGYFGIPFSQQEIVIFKLLDLVKINRGNNHDVVVDFHTTINLYSQSQPSIDPKYKITGEEKGMLAYLRKNCCLLLTGVSLCGKSQTALYIASVLCKETSGLNYKMTSGFLEAENFLLDNSTETRLCLLEDPFGQAYSSEKHSDYKKLERLILHIKSKVGRFVIITSNKDVLFSLADYNIIVNNWHDLTVKNRSFLLEFWDEISFGNRTELLSTVVSRILEKDSTNALLQPGQLTYINRYGDELEIINEHTIRHLANFNSVSIEQRIKDSGKGIIDIMLIFGIAATTTSGITEEDLSYLIGSEQQYLPGINTTRDSIGTYLIGNIEAVKPQLETYKDLSPLQSDTHSEIESAIDKNFIHFSQGHYKFSHPFFEGGAKRLLNTKDNPIRLQKVLYYVEKGLGSLNIKAALNTIESLYILSDYLNTQLEVDKSLYLLAAKGLNSTFLNVRAATLQYLVYHFNNLPGDLAKKIEEKIRNNAFFSSDFEWAGDVAFIPNNRNWSNTSGFVSRMLARLNASEIWTGYLVDKKRLPPDQALLVMEHLVRESRTQKKRIDFSPEILLPFLRYDEVFIVEDAAYLLAASLNDVNFNHFKEILIEDRPLVKFQLLKGLIRAWPYFKEEEIKTEVLKQMKHLIDNRFVALSALDLFTQFNAGHTSFTFDWRYEVEEFAVKEMWSLWTELSIIFVKNLPFKISVHDARFSDTIREASTYKPAKIGELILTWIIWLEKHFYHQDKYETEVSRCILFFFDLNLDELAHQRLSIIQRAFKIKNTIFHSRLLRVVTNNWQNYTLYEQQEITTLIKPASPFHQAIILTSLNCPTEIYKLFCRGQVITAMDAESVISMLDEKLLLCCITVLYVYPPTTELDYNDFTTWNPVISHLVNKPEHDGFFVAAKIYIEQHLTYNRIGLCKWPSCETLKLILSQECSETQLAFVFDVIIDNLGGNEAVASKFLAIFFESISTDQQNIYGEKLEQLIEMISNADNLESLPSSILRKYVNPMLEVDIAIIATLKYNSHLTDNEKHINFFAGLILHGIENRKIRLKNTILTVRDWARRHKTYFSESQLDTIEKYLTLFFDTSSQQRHELYDKIHNQFSQCYL